MLTLIGVNLLFLEMINKALKLFTILLLSVSIVIFIGIVWPLPDVIVPEAYRNTLISNVNIIDVESGGIVYNQEVLIVENRIGAIDSIGKIKRPDGVFVIEGKGNYIIPGLWNMHNHSTQYSNWLYHPLQIANGVTGVRDMSGQLGRYDSYWVGTKERKEWNAGIISNQTVAPRSVLHSSYQMDGRSSVPENFPEFFRLQKDEDVAQLLNHYQKDGSDFIKTYMNIPSGVYKKLAEEAPNYGLHLAGHKPLNVSLREAVLLGQRSFEHGRVFMYDCFPGAEALRDPIKRGKQFQLPKEAMIKEFNKEEALEIMGLMKEQNTHWVPTLQTLKMGAFASDSTFVNNPNLKYIPTIRRKAWWGPDLSRYTKKNAGESEESVDMKFYKASQQQVAMAQERGVLIMMGTDVTDTYVFPGYSAHIELKDLTLSGLSNVDALRTATIIPAKYCGLEKDHGTVEEGKFADIVLLTENPLENIENTQSISGVILNGVYYDSKKLESLKEATASLASSFHMNVKIAYSLISSPLIRVQFAD